MANELAYNSNDNDDFIWHDDFGEHLGISVVGHPDVLGEAKGILRFPSVPIAQGVTVSSAILYCFMSEVSSSSGTLRLKVYGVDEDNTATLSSGNPFNRPMTTAETAFADTKPNVNTYEDFVVTSQVNEILARGGWSSGNAMAFMLQNNGSDTNIFVTSESGDLSYLLIRLAAEPDFFPDPTSIGAPLFPDPSSQGLKISMPGVDVRNATEAQLLLTTRKKEFKIIKEGSIDVTAGVEQTIAHGLPYYPSHLAYVESGGYRLKLNRDFLGATDPITNGAQGYIGADASNVRIIIDKTKNVYYYIFIDPLEES